MAKQVCVEDGTKYDGVNEDGSAAVCPECGSDQYQSEGLDAPEEKKSSKKSKSDSDDGDKDKES